jgi:hypothetical protein
MNGLKPPELNQVKQQKAGTDNEYPGNNGQEFFMLRQLRLEGKRIKNKRKARYQV